MRRPLTALALILAASPLWAGEPVMSSLFIGEHKSTTPTDRGSAADYAETSSRQTALGEEAPPPPPALPAAQEETEPAPLARQSQAASPAPVTPREQQRSARAPQPAPARIGGFVRRDPAAQRYYEQPAQERLSDAVADGPRRQPDGGKAYKLWDSVAAPVTMTATQVARTPGVDEAEAAAGDEYERRILGRAAGAGGPALAAAGAAPDMPAGFGAAAPAVPPPASAAKPAAGEVFVSVDLAASEKADLKDAVAGLTSATGFRPDPRFPPQTSELHAPDAAARQATNLRGWMPADKLNAAVTAAGVLRVQVDHGGPRPESAASALTTLVVGLRIPAQASAGETFKRTISELSSAARFRWTRTIGFQSIPNSKDVALVVVGEVPVTRIPRLLEHPGVLKVAPAPLEPRAAEAPERPRSRAAEFLSYARQKAPLLVVLTLLLLLRPVAGVALKLGQAFVPYER